MRGGLRVIRTDRDSAERLEKKFLRRGLKVALVKEERELKSSFLSKADIVLVVEEKKELEKALIEVFGEEGYRLLVELYERGI